MSLFADHLNLDKLVLGRGEEGVNFRAFFSISQWHWGLLLFVFSLTSCQPVGGATLDGSTVTPVISKIPNTLERSSDQQETPTITITPKIMDTARLENEVIPSLTPSPTRVSFQLCSPLAWETIETLFEIISDPYRAPPLNRPEERHHGVDFSHYSRNGRPSIEGEPILSILEGQVVSVINDRLPYGNMIIVETHLSQLPDELVRAIGGGVGQSLYVLYAHLAEAPTQTLGDRVACGQEIGAVGKTGYNIVNPHLHLETRLGDKDSVFPAMAFYITDASNEERETYTRWRTSGEFIHFDPILLFQSYLDWLAKEP
jgi:murein DD-endopeptidase MepM/ murein hydrolase activator NlpD